VSYCCLVLEFKTALHAITIYPLKMPDYPHIYKHCFEFMIRDRPIDRSRNSFFDSLYLDVKLQGSR
jgi:hypothetical protein